MYRDVERQAFEGSRCLLQSLYEAAGAAEARAMTDRLPELSPPRQRMRIERHEVPTRSAVIRTMDFREVNLGYSQVLAMEEAERCLDCRNPRCIDGCPVRVNIPRFIELLAEGDLAGAAGVAPRRQRPALRHRPGLPPGDAVRGRSASAARRASRWPSARWSASWPTGPWSTATS